MERTTMTEQETASIPTTKLWVYPLFIHSLFAVRSL